MVAFPNCKINLGLNVIRKRNDRFHDIETVFYPIPLHDALEVIASAGDETVQLSTTGELIKGEAQENLCYKAYHALKKDFPHLPAIKMHLHKTIPIGAGLGGGSSDAAFALTLINDSCNLRLSKASLLNYALQLGSDCPFFLINKPCFATGRGENLERVELNLSAYKLLIVSPGLHLNTTEAFSTVVPVMPSKSINEIIRQPMETWRSELKNDFEEPVFQKHGEIKNIKQSLYAGGAIYASMTGTGSTIYGIFEKDHNLEFSFPSHYFVRESLG